MIQAQAACLSSSPINTLFLCLHSSQPRPSSVAPSGWHTCPAPLILFAPAPPPPTTNSTLYLSGSGSGSLLSAAALSAFPKRVLRSWSFHSTLGSVGVLTLSALCFSWVHSFLAPAGLELPEGWMVSQQSLGATRTAPALRWCCGASASGQRWAEMRPGWLGVQLPGPPPPPGPGSCVVAAPPPVTVTPSCVCFHCRPRAPTAADSLAETRISCHFLLTLE